MCPGLMALLFSAPKPALLSTHSKEGNYRWSAGCWIIWCTSSKCRPWSLRYLCRVPDACRVPAAGIFQPCFKVWTVGYVITFPFLNINMDEEPQQPIVLLVHTFSNGMGLENALCARLAGARGGVEGWCWKGAMCRLAPGVNPARRCTGEYFYGFFWNTVICWWWMLCFDEFSNDVWSWLFEGKWLTL